ncbi:MAG TPA: xanthine dehydrogenase family protein subunit M [Fimbriimonadales bacterium]|nr:xanthine dehydrogenase family protein subunit M [Fimbriimonadales bacterium]
MNNFRWLEAKNIEQAANEASKGGAFLAGGIELLCLLKEHLIEPPTVINLKSIPELNKITSQKGLRLGALVTLTELANHREILTNYRALAQAAESVASPQIRNVGTLGGNLCQRPRCWYFRDKEVPCLKKGGELCFAVGGNNEYHAILGGGPCYIIHPSDLAPPLIAFDATVVTNKRKMKLEEFFILPRKNVHAENVLEKDELVTHVEIPDTWKGSKSTYYKVKERPSFDWALSSCAAVLKMDGDTIADARIVLGGVAPIPWRSREAENALKGKKISESVAESAGRAAVSTAAPLSHNAYKVKLTANVVKIAILEASGKV